MPIINNLRQQTLSGLGWAGASRVVRQALQFGLTIVLARLLSPREFGLMGMIVVFTGFALALSDTGLKAALIQKQEVSDRHLNSVFWVNVMIGAFLTTLFGLAAPLIAKFYNEPLLQLLTTVVAINFVLGSLNIVQDALLDKSLNFRRKFWIESVSIIASGIVALVLVLNGAGVWSLVGQSITSIATRVAVMWRLSTWRPTMSFDPSAMKELMHFSGHLLGSQVMWYWGRDFDKLVVGRMIGSSALGVYNMAFKFMMLPIGLITQMTGQVMFPALSAIQNDVESVKRIYLRSTRMIALITFPMMIGLIVLAEPVVLIVYGNKWREAISIVQILSLAGMVSSVGATIGWLFLSQGRTDIQFRWSIFSGVVRLIGALVGVYWGIIGVAWAHVLCSYVIIWVPSWSAAGRLVNLRFSEMIGNLAGPFYCAVSMGMVVGLSDSWFFAYQALWIRLIVHVVMGIFIYRFLIQRFRLKAMEEFQQVILDMGGQRYPFIRWLVGA